MTDFTTGSLAKALVAFQADLEPVDKNSANPFFKSKYADLTEVKTTVQPLLAKHKLAVTQWPTTLDGKPALRTRIIHESGEYDEDTMLLMNAKDDPQGQGSGITYAKRYAFMAALGIVADEDDDGNKASAKTPIKYAPVEKKPNQERPLPSENQLSKIRELSRELGYDESAVEERIGEIETTGDAMKAIAKLQELVNSGNK
jgi:hypothetical protein